jgi:hypothetical protein
MDILDRLRRCALPVIFETDIDDFPCSTVGTAFIVGFRQSVFILMPQHVVKDCPVEKVRIYPSWNHQYTFRYLDSWQIKTTPEDPDASDLLIIKADLSDIPLAERKDIQLIDLNSPDNVAWYDERHDSQFFLCGFPSAGSEGVNYSTLEIRTSQYFLEGVYVDVSLISCCHRIKVKNPLNLCHFGGLSGSPVFSHRCDNTVGTPSRFCGMVLRGTASSGYIHFLGVEFLMKALTEIENRNNSTENPQTE